jgi:phosphoribosylamine---glycine ligase
MMNILILGSGGREHTFAWKIAQSPLCQQLYVAPGNAGTSQVAENVEISVNDFEKIGALVIAKNIQLVLVGPEEPLVKGIKGYFDQHPMLKNIPLIGPDQKGAMLEGSKDFSKAFMQKYHIPTAAYATFTAENIENAFQFIDNQTPPIVLKADGLAAGKGVIITEDKAEAKAVLREMLLDGKFGEASRKVVIEQFLKGIELSVFVITDGISYKILPEAKDYKRIGEGDTGLNTGGMGAVSPVPFAQGAFMQKVIQQIIEPTMKGLLAEGIDYVGFIFFGLINVEGNPYTIEYNARMGDPETEVVIPRIQSDFVEILQAVAEKRLSEIDIHISSQTATTVVAVSGGYPGDYEKGKVITALDDLEDVLVFHAGTTLKNDEIVTNGGRVLAFTALGDSIEDALQKSKKAAEITQFEGKYFRKDIGLDLT